MFDNESEGENGDFGIDSSGSVETRLVRFGDARKYVRGVMVPYLVQVDPHRAGKVALCGTALGFREYVIDGKYYSELFAGNFCQMPKLCPCCSIRRSGKMLRIASGKLTKLLIEDPQRHVYHVVLTVKDGPDLLERLAHLRNGLQRLRQRRKDFFRGKGRNTVWSVPDGWICNMEIVRGSGSGIWHPHYHMIWVTRGEIVVDEIWDKLAAEWFEVTGDSNQVFVGEFGFSEGKKWREMVKGPDDWQFMQDIIAIDLPECCKYITKFNHFTLAEDAYFVFDMTFGMRLMASGGVLQFSKEESAVLDVMTDEHEERLDGMPYTVVMARWSDGYEMTREEVGGLIYESRELAAEEERKRELEMLLALAE